MDPLKITQGSGEWLQYRLGSVGSSGLAAVLSRLKRSGESSETREKYKLEKLAEITTGQLKAGYVSFAMEFGTATEPLARATYEQRTGQDVRVVGIQPHPTITRAHASPDGYVGQDGAIEIKCPESSTHLRYLAGDMIPEEYGPQCWWVLACSGRAWLDFVSFDPRQTERLQLFIKRLYRNDKMIADLNAAVEEFWGEVDALKSRLDELYPPIAEPEPAAREPDWAAETYLSDAELEAFI